MSLEKQTPRITREPKLENGLISKGFRTEGYFVVVRRGRMMLERFNRISEEFDASNTGDISLLREIIVQDQQESIVDGVINLN